MAKDLFVPGFGMIHDEEEGKEYLVPGFGFFGETAAVEPTNYPISISGILGFGGGTLKRKAVQKRKMVGAI